MLKGYVIAVHQAVKWEFRTLLQYSQFSKPNGYPFFSGLCKSCTNSEWTCCIVKFLQVKKQWKFMERKRQKNNERQIHIKNLAHKALCLLYERSLTIITFIAKTIYGLIQPDPLVQMIKVINGKYFERLKHSIDEKNQLFCTRCALFLFSLYP